MDRNITIRGHDFTLPTTTPFWILLSLSILLLSARTTIDPSPVGDFSQNWQVQAEMIVTGGEPYLDKWDNKTPLWHYLHAIIYLTPAPHLVFLMAVSVVNAAAAYLLGIHATDLNLTSSQVVPGVIYLILLANFDGFTVNSRMFATLFLLLGLRTHTPARAGLWTSLACLMHQYYGLTIPAVVAYHWWLNPLPNRGLREFAKFAAIGMTVVTGAYLSILLIWGGDAFTASIEFSVFGIIGFINRGMATSDAVWRGFGTWIRRVSQPVQHSPAVLVALLFALFGWGTLLRDAQYRVAGWLSVLTISLAAPLLIDPVTYYWTAPAVTAAMLASISVTDL